MTEKVMVFAPIPLLTVTVEEQQDGTPDIHVHSGGQGVWQARVLVALGVDTVLCGTFGGESGPIARQLIESEGITVHPVVRQGRNGTYVHDRRGGSRSTVAETPGDPLTRHDLDDLYSVALAEGLKADTSILSGPADPSLVSPETYRRLTNDLRANGGKIVVDLCGDLLRACLQGGVDLLKISHEEVIADGRADDDDPEQLVAAMRALRDEGADTVLVSRADNPALALIGDEILQVPLPRMEVVEPRGAGDSMTAGITAALARGTDPKEAVRFAAAAGALNVTRHGLGTVHEEAVRELARRIELEPYRPGTS
ncbi:MULTISPECIES: 1-phosphofructokinase family hexose kinase [Streptomyces]|uniref:1-phosphofructokinase family hexose kinase n=2 Tax=Streptomyces TaxID=1883 RepID=UPI001C70B0D2|nr:PfkB family carbohydrate kinase [Streptomyces sp. SCUT-3]